MQLSLMKVISGLTAMKESQLQADKERKRKMESYQDGLLLQHEVEADASLDADLEKQKKNDAKNADKLIKHRKLQESRPQFASR